MIQMVADRVESEGSTGRLWAHLFADLFKSVFSEHARIVSGSLRARSVPLWGVLLVAGAVFGGVVALVGAINEGYGSGSVELAESSIWLMVSYGIILVAFTAAVITKGVRGSPRIGSGIVLMVVGQLSVIINEAHFMNVALTVPTLGAASAFPVMLGVGLIAAGMSESPNWSKTHVWSTVAVVIVPLVMALGAYPAVLNATGSEVSAGLLFRAGYMINWTFVGATFVLARTPNTQTRT